MSRELCQQLITLRQSNPAWVMLASNKAPLTASCLKTILDSKPIGVPWDEAVEVLARIFAEHANDPIYELSAVDDFSLAARRELRSWLKRGLVVERDGQLMATDMLERALQFLTELEDRTMTSTASRLATVQREIESLEARLNPDQDTRVQALQDRLAALQKELAAAKEGDFEVLTGAHAEENIREIYQLALSLRADFRRVEDSYRQADRELRQRILAENHHRGSIVDQLLDNHDSLVETAEGQVFASFHDQLVKPLELDRMKQRLRSILGNEAASQSLKPTQQRELRALIPNLVSESQGVIEARARSERDVRSFLKSGLADEQIKVGNLLTDLLSKALDVDWASQKVRRTPSPLPPLAIKCSNLKLIERLGFREAEDDESLGLQLHDQTSSLDNLGADFWQAFQSLDRAELFEKTLQLLREKGEPITIRELALALPPSHDLETLTFWLAMAREAGIPLAKEVEEIDLVDPGGQGYRFTIPATNLTYEKSRKTTIEQLG